MQSHQLFNYSINNLKMGTVEHEGIVEKVSEDHVTVRITSESACAGCHAKSACTLSNSEDKMIDIYTKEKVSTGQKVMIVGTQGQAFKATWIAYLLPVILVVIVLAITNFLSKNEELSGILALAVIIPYFLILRTINDRLKKTFSFKIKLIKE